MKKQIILHFLGTFRKMPYICTDKQLKYEKTITHGPDPDVRWGGRQCQGKRV